MITHIVDDSKKPWVVMYCGKTVKANPHIHFTIEQRIGSVHMDKICKTCYKKYLKSKTTQTT